MSDTTANPNSRTAQIAALAVGETYSESRRLTFEDGSAQDRTKVAAEMRNNIAPCARRATDRTSKRYIIEAGYSLSLDDAVLVTIAVTCTSDLMAEADL